MEKIKVLFLDIDGVVNTYSRALHTGRITPTGECNFRHRKLFLLGFKISRFIFKIYEKLPFLRKIMKPLLKFLLLKFENDQDFCPSSIHNLNRLLDKFPNLRIVISSVWKADGLIHMQELLQKHGLKKGSVISCNPTAPNADGYRGKDIELWLQGWERNPQKQHYYLLENSEPKHVKRQDYEIESFVILDDDSDMDPYMDRLVQTDSWDGFTNRDYKKCVEILDLPYKLIKKNTNDTM